MKIVNQLRERLTDYYSPEMKSKDKAFLRNELIKARSNTLSIQDEKTLKSWNGMIDRMTRKRQRIIFL